MKNTEVTRQIVQPQKSVSQHYADVSNKENSSSSQAHFNNLLALQNQPTIPASRNSVIELSLNNSQQMATGLTTQITSKTLEKKAR